VTCSRKSFRSHQDSQGCTIIGGKKFPNEEREMPNGTSHSYMSMPLELECSNALKDVIEGNLTENGIPNNATVEELFSSQVKTDTRKIEYDTTFKPPYVLNILDNKKGQRIIQVAMALPSGVQHSDVMVSVDNDYEHLNVTIPMDPNLADGWTVNGDLVFNAKSLSPEQRSENFFVYSWDSVIKHMRTSEGMLPRFRASIKLPEVLCSKDRLRMITKESRTGTNLLVVDLLIEESNLPGSGKKTHLKLEDVPNTEYDG